MDSNNNWPSSDYDSMVEFYGDVGKNQTRFIMPYPLRLSWNTEVRVRRITCHRKVGRSMQKAMEEIMDHYGYAELKRLRLDIWGGCLNVRKTRHGSSWSKHSWGVANDWYPQENGLHTPWDEARFSDPEYVAFFNAWIREGWNPLGLSWGRDAMHIEATANDVQLIET